MLTLEKWNLTGVRGYTGYPEPVFYEGVHVAETGRGSSPMRVTGRENAFYGCYPCAVASRDYKRVSKACGINYGPRLAPSIGACFLDALAIKVNEPQRISDSL